MNTERDIISVLVYFNLFNYPLREKEVLRFMPNQCDKFEFEMSLSELLAKKVVFRIGEFYSLQKSWYLTYYRQQGNERAQKMLVKAEKLAHFLSAFPFVKGVGISGSLSKEFADLDSDIDFFIITTGNRLWIARTIMHCFKKVTFLFNRQHYFCMNYYVDELMLEIEEKNIYTATEIVTLIPCTGIDVFKKFYYENRWTQNFLPNNYLRSEKVKDVPKNFLSKFIEYLLLGSIGNFLEYCCMKITAYRWNNKTKNRVENAKGRILSMVAKKNISKPDPLIFQEKIVNDHLRECQRFFSILENASVRTHQYYSETGN